MQESLWKKYETEFVIINFEKLITMEKGKETQEIQAPKIDTKPVDTKPDILMTIRRAENPISEQQLIVILGGHGVRDSNAIKSDLETLITAKRVEEVDSKLRIVPESRNSV